MLNVVCVLRSGGVYKPDHVWHLREGVRRNLTLPYRFACLSDKTVDGIHTIPLKHDWPGWFSKIEMFRGDLFDGPVFYADLDTVITGSLDKIILGHSFTVLRNFWVKPHEARIGSGLMAWNADLSAIYERFCDDPARHMAECVTRENWGDQGFIQRMSPIPMERWQDKHPAAIASWKMHCRGGVPKTASVVCFHGLPRPWSTHLWSVT